MRRIFHLIFRPSTLIRGFWLGIAALHAALFLRRLAEGEWIGSFNQARLVLALAAAVYGAVKMWRVATIFDNSRHKVFAFALLLVVGHFALSPSTYTGVARDVFAGIEWSHVVVTSSMTLFAAGAMLVGREAYRFRANRVRTELIPIRIEIPRSQSSRREFSLYQRPPPRNF
ncbi:hypothetical protein HYR69_00310 [Candidatus Sumerlaeota bacterium]|nr:hypothetical protein [Candidatus Sumerlaeota bacterium]MBI3737034.1 hypothetical protein [Candidatus Sumerlaeota bacterium]